MPGPAPLPNPLESVFEQHHGLVFRTAYRITGNPADAEDVLQTVFLRLLKRNEPEPMHQPESYLRRSAINASLDLIRTRREVATGALPEPAAGSGEELRHSLKQALASLDPKHAEMFILRFFEGHSNQEIARMLGVSALLVAVTLHRTRNRLQKMLTPSGDLR